MNENLDEKANFIEVRLNNGTVLRAKGEHAAEVWSWLRSCETVAWIHGSRFSGKPMDTISQAGTGDAPGKEKV